MTFNVFGGMLNPAQPNPTHHKKPLMTFNVFGGMLNPAQPNPTHHKKHS